jgi:hypothetical protein
MNRQGSVPLRPVVPSVQMSIQPKDVCCFAIPGATGSGMRYNVVVELRQGDLDSGRRGREQAPLWDVRGESRSDGSGATKRDTGTGYGWTGQVDKD